MFLSNKYKVIESRPFASVYSHLSTIEAKPMESDVSFMLPESMPSKNDATFITQLEMMIPEHRRLKMKSERDCQNQERPIHLLWAPAIYYMNPKKEFQACLYLTTEQIYIFEVKALTSDFEIPELSLKYVISLSNLQQVALGYQNLFFRIEEGYLGPMGTFTFITANSGKTDLFLDSLKLANRRLVPDFDQYEDPHIIANTSTESRLKKVLAKIEQVKADQLEIVLYTLVNMCSEGSRKKSFTCHTLVITSRYLYILREDYCYWPQPTFSLVPPTTSQFEVVVALPIHSKIAQFQMYDSDTCEDSQQSLASPFFATNTSAMLTPHFIGYGIRLVFDLGGASGTTKVLDLRMSTPNIRNKFLEALNSSREKVAEKSPRKVKFKLTESDISTESAGSSGKGAKPKKKVKKRSSRAGSCKHDLKDKNPPTFKEDDDRSQKLNTAISPSDDMFGGQKPLTDRMESVEESYFVEMATERSTVNKEDKLVLPPQTLAPASPPSDLALLYPSIDLLSHLTECNENVRLLSAMSENLQTLSNMTGEEVLNFFHSKLGQIGTDGEELRHLLWTDVVPYINPRQVIVTCVMLSTAAVYFVSDDRPKCVKPPPWRKHVRYRSDMSQLIKLSTSVYDSSNQHHSSGIVQKLTASHQDKLGKNSIMAFCILPLKDLKTVEIGLFDQSFRLCGESPDNVFSCVTRNVYNTEKFMSKLMSILPLVESSPCLQTPEPMTSVGSEQDFYRMFRDKNYYSCSLSNSLEYIHASNVKFVYPKDDVVADLTCVIQENLKNQKGGLTNILYYMPCYKENADKLNAEITNCGDYSKYEPRTIVMTEHHLTLLVEDYVSYPVPDFARQPPMHKQHIVLEVRSLKHLKCLVTTGDQHLTLRFTDECEEVLVDAALEYYTPVSGHVDKGGEEVPEITWSVLVQGLNDKQRFMKTVSEQWSEMHGGLELPVKTD